MIIRCRLPVLRLAAAVMAVVLGLALVTARAEPFEVALLQGLDKVTARVSTLRAPINRTVHFGTLEIVARTCRKRPPEEPPESAAFLQIRDIKPGEAPEILFQGWMFASSPALSALEHPVYDIWVIDCLSRIGPRMTLSP